MWLFTKYGFYSISRKTFPGTDKPIQVRARRRRDIQNLKDHLKIEDEIRHTPKQDYHYRVLVDEKELIRIMLFLAENLDYPNFKRSIHEKHDQHDKLGAYNQVLRMMFDYQKTQK